MPSRRTHIAPRSARGSLTAALTALREEFEVPDDFPADVLTEAETAAASGPAEAALDLRDVPFVTLDPPGSRDLDQAFHIERSGHGFVLRYAIADVPAFVRPGGAVDAEARRRGQTLYLPDGTVPLHPPVLSEDRASLLPGAERTAYVWTIPVDEHGLSGFEGSAAGPARVERAVIRSRSRLDYVSAQRDLDAETAEEPLLRLREFGRLRIEQELRRGGASLNLPDEEIVRDAHGYRIERRSPLAVEDWNAQLSLLAGMVAARMMLDGGIGILRTMPAAEESALSEFRGRVAALGLPWDEAVDYGDYLRSVPRGTTQGMAVLHAASSLFRGADYTVFGVRGQDGAPIAPPERPEQAAIAAPYAHVTAPLRRLVDRWGLVICASLCAETPVPEWAVASLADLPALMRASSSRAGRLGAAALDRIEAALLHDRVGEALPATVLEVRGSRTRLQIEDPPVTALGPAETPAGGALKAGANTGVRVLRADVPSGEIELTIA
ncbi:RNB domain-containing ribonuclease [Leucobacter ruminantium]|uniref:RNB domain-containing ribonuclease n=1 Tax=Leucobacter ruminantium TaxID=1289170 RepID=A0A939LXD1_9MICO|nr:RNB domain-containing ribonuclease [Leucobacter ruminantium]MBO1804137.1 RNB domain-containing ribonuclease [Leucobacter ruminantium]